jgi:hypothetical protein
MQVQIIQGVTADEAGDFRSALPRNLIPVPKESGISSGYLRPADGIVQFATGTGSDRGGINWNGACYRVMGTSLIRVEPSGAVTLIGDVGEGGPVSFDYSFEALAIASGGRLYYWDGLAMNQVVDPDLRICVDVIWVDGYFMSTDGEYLVVTELNSPTTISTLKYGSAEADSDGIKGIIKLNGRPHALGRYSIEQFVNVGGSNFPFERVEGALIQRGVVGTHAACAFAEQIAFVGSGHNEPPAVWIGANGVSVKLSTREVDTLLQDYTEAQLAGVKLEARVEKSHQQLYIHLPDCCLVYDHGASQAVQMPVWTMLVSGTGERGTYRARDFVWCYDKWICGDPTSHLIGTTTHETGEHYGNKTGWSFATPIMYNEGRGMILHAIELVALPGRVPLGADPVIWTSHSSDGETWSMPRGCRAGKIGERGTRITWLRQGRMENWRIQKFEGTSDAHLSFARLEIQPEPLYA